MSNRLFQGVVHQMREAIDRTIGVIDETMSIIACSDLGRIGEVCEAITTDSFNAQDAFVRDGYTYKPFGSRPRSEHILFPLPQLTNQLGSCTAVDNRGVLNG